MLIEKSIDFQDFFQENFRGVVENSKKKIEKRRIIYKKGGAFCLKKAAAHPHFFAGAIYNTGAGVICIGLIWAVYNNIIMIGGGILVRFLFAL